MYVEKLKELSLRFVVRSLRLMSEVCKKNCLLIPHSLGMEIFSYICNDQYNYCLNDMNFFSSNIMQLTSVKMKNKDLAEGLNGGFLRNHPVKSLSLTNYHQINKLHLSPLLENFEMINCNLQSSDINYLGRLLSNCCWIKVIRLEETVNHLKCLNSATWQKGFQEICEGLKSSSNCLVKIEVIDCSLTGIQSSSLGDLLKQCTMMQEIDLSFDTKCREGLKKTFDGLKSSVEHLLNVKLSLQLNEKVCIWLGDFLAQCSSLRQIYLCSLGGYGHELKKKIFIALQSSSASLFKIALVNVSLTEEEGYSLGDLFKRCNSLREIHFQGADNYVKGLEWIFDGLKSSSDCLIKLELGKLSLSERSSAKLGNLLKDCRRLEEIRLNENDIQKNGLEKILKGLKSSSNSLLEINIKCQLSEGECCLLGDFLKGCNSIRQMKFFTDNKHGKKGIGRIIHGLKSSSGNLLKINNDEYSFNDGETVALGDLLEQCTSLREIQFISSACAERGFEKLFAGLGTSCRSLSKICLSGCKLNKKTGFRLGALLKDCIWLGEFYMTKSRVSGEGFEKIFDGLSTSSQTLLNISFSDCDLNEEEAYCLGDLFEKCSSLQEINLSNNTRYGKAFERILEGRSVFSSINQNPPVDGGNDVNGFGELCYRLSFSSKSLLEMSFSNCNLTEQQSLSLADLLKECKLLRKVNLSLNSRCGNSLKGIFVGLRSSAKSLVEVILGGCQFNEEQSHWLGDFLRECNSLDRAILWSNDSWGKGFKDVCEGLKSSSHSLSEVDFSNCKLNEEQSFWFGDFLKQCNSLQKASLSRNENCRKGFKAICEGLKSSSKSLLEITIGCCNINQEQSFWLGDALKECNSLEYFGFGENDQCGEGFRSICDGLKSSSKSLSLLEFWQCKLSEEQGCFLGDFLKECNSLEIVALYGNKHLQQGFMKIIDGLKSSSNSLKDLGLFECDLTKEQRDYCDLYLGRRCSF
ncbi:DgyrCDS890 [Dimorphilus gyrociliatus]|uniref:DgyrCDS890 n=1 Tax=Dimorphilus gyrociliatus TaxID=2664684 RepID=A0A7I8V758_9ANNE|nr:DgyrCDS890 [Dimorphilus gyrociliatus]